MAPHTPRFPMSMASEPMAASRRLSLLLIAVMLATLGAMARPAPTLAVSSTSLEATLASMINATRVNAGLKGLRADGDLSDIAGLRATRMRDANTMNHTVGGNLAAQLAWYKVAWYRYGENVAATSYPWGSQAAVNIHAMWMASPSHRDLILSKSFNYIGVGLAYRSTNGRTFASVVFAESPDQTSARASITSGTRSGRSITWTWNGNDPVLQTHTAGLRDFDVQYRIDSGAWRTLRNDTTSRSLTVTDRASRMTYGLRVRATDRRGNVGPWTAEKRIWVP